MEQKRRSQNTVKDGPNSVTPFLDGFIVKKREERLEKIKKVTPSVDRFDCKAAANMFRRGQPYNITAYVSSNEPNQTFYQSEMRGRQNLQTT